MTTPPVIVFDLDGTLVDTAQDLVATLNVILARERLAPLSFDNAVALIGNGARAMLQAGFAASGQSLAPERLESLFGDFLAWYGDHLVDTSRPFQGTAGMLDRFAEAGWRLAVCTNKLEAPSRKLLALLGLADRFAAIAGQDTFGVRKPDPRHLVETIRAAGGSPERAVLVGDSHIDVDTAIAAGIPVVAVSFGYSPTPVSSLGATAVVDHFDDLYAAVSAIIGQPAHPA
jgi:phosphoglycolate phosphatase